MRNVLITGASRGIGRAAAELFAENGWNVIINYNKSAEKAEQVKTVLVSRGLSAETYAADVSDEADVKKMFSYIGKKYGALDALVNNAGMSMDGLITDVTPAEWDAIFSVNMRAAFLVTNRALPAMINARRGAIVNVSSVWGIAGASCEVAYSSTKAALIGYTKALAREVGLSGITVNCVCPGVIDTDMNANYGAQTLKELGESSALGRIGTPREVAQAIYFLASENASFITGQALIVDGGFI